MLMSQKAYMVHCKMCMYNSAKFPLAHMVQEKKELTMSVRAYLVLFHTVHEKNARDWTEKMSVHAQ